MRESYTYGDFIASLKYLEAEGYIERFFDENGQECVRIADGAENAKI